MTEGPAVAEPRDAIRLWNTRLKHEPAEDASFDVWWATTPWANQPDALNPLGEEMAARAAWLRAERSMSEPTEDPVRALGEAVLHGMLDTLCGHPPARFTENGERLVAVVTYIPEDTFDAAVQPEREEGS